MTIPQRWTARRKEELIREVRASAIKREALLAFYDISPEEYAEWERLYDAFDRPALRTTRLKEYR